jgi:hypothetical protein
MQSGVFRLLTENIRASSEAEYLAKLEQQAHFLFRHLRPMSWFKNLLQSMEQLLSQGNPLSFNHTMASSATYRVTLQGRNAAAPVNIQRQPSRYGVRIILSGKLRIHSYVLDDPRVKIGNPVTLRLASQQQYGVEETASYSPSVSSISASEPLSDYYLLLCLQAPGASYNEKEEVMPVYLHNANHDAIVCDPEQLHLV